MPQENLPRISSDVGTLRDRIEKRVVLQAPRSRVWKALADAGEFGSWFGVRLYRPFAEETTVHGQITYPGYEHLTIALFIVRIEPERYLSWRWHPHAVDPWTDYSQEPTTLVDFTLEDAAGDTALTIVESGFDRIPLARREQAFRMNDEGWTQQVANIKRHVSAPSLLDVTEPRQ